VQPLQLVPTAGYSKYVLSDKVLPPDNESVGMFCTHEDRTICKVMGLLIDPLATHL